MCVPPLSAHLGWFAQYKQDRHCLQTGILVKGCGERRDVSTVLQSSLEEGGVEEYSAEHLSEKQVSKMRLFYFNSLSVIVLQVLHQLIITSQNT